MDIKLLDCTLRDGGYYNNWEFSRDLIKEYLVAMHAAKIDVVEIGFRTFSTNIQRGPCAYSTDSFIRDLDIPEAIQIGVMVNASDLIGHNLGPQGSIKLLFTDQNESPVKLVRLACHFHEYEEVLPVCDWLKQKGYTIGLNLMQVDKCSFEDLENAAKIINKHSVDILYFADSFGSLDNEQTINIINSLKKSWKKPLGIHTHDNMGRALSNTLSALSNGTTYIDSTVTGMGRGPGNVQTEYVLIELNKLDERKYNLIPILRLINEYFLPLQSKYGWGKNPYYYLAGQEGIHPTYIQEMINDKKYGESEILQTIDHLKKIGGRKFSNDALNIGLTANNHEPLGTWNPLNLIEGKDLMVIGSGPGSKNFSEVVEKYINDNKVFVIALNKEKSIDDKLIDLRIACHPFNLMIKPEDYLDYDQPLVVPEKRLSSNIRMALNNKEIFNYGMQIKPGYFEFFETGAITPSPIVLAYTIAIASSGKANRIMLVGFDGYEDSDIRARDINEIFDLYKKTNGSCKIEASTPSKYNIPYVPIEGIE